jgi:hypothetical protein
VRLSVISGYATLQSIRSQSPTDALIQTLTNAPRKIFPARNACQIKSALDLEKQVNAEAPSTQRRRREFRIIPRGLKQLGQLSAPSLRALRLCGEGAGSSTGVQNLKDAVIPLLQMPLEKPSPHEMAKRARPRESRYRETPSTERSRAATN